MYHSTHETLKEVHMQLEMSRERAKGFARLRQPYRLLGVVLWVVAVASISALGQGVRGTITGQITDSAGAVVPGASVKLVNVVTNQQVRSISSDSSGNYQLLELEPGTYNLLVSMNGFSDLRLENVKLEPDRHLTLDIALRPAGQSEQITVNAGSELIDRETPTLGTTVDNRRILGLPLNGRNVLNLALLQPGVVPINDPDGTRFGTGFGFLVNGSRGVENNLTLDGANNNEVAVGGAIGSLPTPDAVQEFRLLTSNFEPEFGRNTGAVINVVTKGGGSSYHGDARVFYRPTFLSAGRFFDNAQGQPKRTFERKQFGGNFGGPVDIPHLYNGKSKTFFFIDYEGTRQLIQDSVIDTGLPTEAERSGLFDHAIVNPATGKPFAGNRIPPGLISPITNYYLQFMPIPDSSGRAAIVGNDTTHDNKITGRLDHQINTKQTLNFIANYSDAKETVPFPFQGIGAVQETLGFPELDSDATYNYVLRHTYSITPTLINSFLVSYSRLNFPSVAPANSTTPAQIGFTANLVSDPRFAGPPAIQLIDRNIILGNSIQGPQTRISQNYQIQDSVSWVKNEHRLKFGFDGTLYRQPQQFLFINNGIFGYSGQVGSPDSTGDDFADFLLGSPPLFFQSGTNGQRDFRQKAAALFSQDDWKVKPNLTLSFGLRWEYNGPLYDTRNRAAYYRPGSVSQLLINHQLTDPSTNLPIVLAPGSTAPNGLVFVGDPDNVLGGKVPAGGWRPYYRSFAPRIGLAYSPRASGGWLGRLLGQDQTVIRAGWGIFYGAQVGDNILQQLGAPGFSGNVASAAPTGGTLADPYAPDPYHNFPQLANPNSFSTTEITTPLTGGGFSEAIDPRLRTPYTVQYNLTVERSFSKNYVATLSYVGSRGHRLYVQENLNPALGTFFPAPRGLPAPNANNANDRRLNPDYQAAVFQLESAGNSWYNALQAQVQKRYSSGLEFQAAYTFSKAMNDADDQRGLLDVLDRAATRGLGSDDRTHRIVFSWIYDLPFARSLHGVLKTALDGFSFSGIAAFASGTPFTVGNVGDSEGTGGSVISFADLGAPLTIMDPRANNGRAFNPNAFVAVQPANLATGFRRGTEGPNQFRLNNGINNWNLGVVKKTRLWNESANLELRLEMFNAFNHAQFTSIDLNLADIKSTPSGGIDTNKSQFGKFVNTAESRVIQLAARITF
jgi:outer membrane receptor protein involved in Fe transport